MRDDFAVFIITHGRAKSQKTYRTLERCGYSGKLFFVIDDEDEQQGEYERLYGSKVIKFSKRKIEYSFDTMTNAKEYRAAAYVRNAAQTIARNLGIRWIFMCDDDISNLQYRILRKNSLRGVNIEDIDSLFEMMAGIMEAGRLAIFGFSQAGAFIGGANKTYLSGHQRKIAQAFMLDADNPVEFRGIFYEDLQAALDVGIQGRVAMSTMLVSIQSPQCATNQGGMHDSYADNSTYVPCFYSVMAHPSVVSIKETDGTFKLRLNHSAFAPLILNERWRK